MKRSKRMFLVLVAMLLIAALMPITAFADGSVSYVDENGSIQTAKTVTEVTSKYLEENDNTLSEGWYVVSSNVGVSGRIKTEGTVHLILADGASLDAGSGGIGISDNGSLTIYGQTAGTGALNATGTRYQAGITVPEGATLTINGGKITATGSAENEFAGAGIGSDCGQTAGTIIIHGGVITATGASADWGGAAGIGGGGCSSRLKSITITGGEVHAHGGENGAAGIGGGGHDGTLGICNITGGTIYAAGHVRTTGDNAGKGNANPIGGGAKYNLADFKNSDSQAIVFDETAKTVTVCGETLNRDLTIPEGYTMTLSEGENLTVAEGATLTISDGAKVTITNNGKLTNYGTIALGVEATIQNNETGSYTNCGTVEQHTADGMTKTVKNVNGSVTEIQYDTAGNLKSSVITDAEGKITEKIIYAENGSYIKDGFTPEIIEGDGAKYDGKNALTFRSDDEFVNFQKVCVDDKELDAKNYEVESGSIKVTLKKEYLDTLEAGEHTLEIVSTNGSAKAAFTVPSAQKKTDSSLKPTSSKKTDSSLKSTSSKKGSSKSTAAASSSTSVNTGDNSNMIFWIVLLIVGICGITGYIVYNRHRKSEK